jgi:hypothetical protein
LVRVTTYFEEDGMSFIITLYVREGIVMASDSRLTLNTTRQEGANQIVNVAVGQSDSNYKTFLAPGDIGISTYGAADIQAVPIAGFVESFIHEELNGKNISVDQIPAKLLAYFRNFSPPPATQFHVAGYLTSEKDKAQQIWAVDVKANATSRLNPPGQQGASWGGEGDILARILMPVAEVDDKGQPTRRPPQFPIPWQFFTLQDAIDFAVFALRPTIDAIRFQPRPKTVGGPIDVLIIKPDGAYWVHRKELAIR